MEKKRAVLNSVTCLFLVDVMTQSCLDAASVAQYLIAASSKKRKGNVPAFRSHWSWISTLLRKLSNRSHMLMQQKWNHKGFFVRTRSYASRQQKRCRPSASFIRLADELPFLCFSGQMYAYTDSNTPTCILCFNSAYLWRKKKKEPSSISRSRAKPGIIWPL